MGDGKNYVFLNGLRIDDGVITLLWIDVMDIDTLSGILKNGGI